MRIDVEKGRMLNAGCLWVHFICRNTDIMTTLNQAPFHVFVVNDRHYKGKIFGVNVELEILGNVEPGPNGEVDIVADVRLPLSLGRTHTVAHYRYRLVEVDVTVVDLRLVLETTGMVMAIYAFFLRRRIDAYLNQVISDNEKAAILLQNNDRSLQQLLSDDQFERVQRFRKKYGEQLKPEIKPVETSIIATLEKRLWDSELSELTLLHQKIGGREDELEKEIFRMRETRDSVATLLIARRMLEVIVTSICQAILKRPRGTEPLAGVIDKITKAEGIPEYVATSMGNLNKLSTYGAHPKDFSPIQVREALLALCSIMEWYAGHQPSQVVQ